MLLLVVTKILSKEWLREQQDLLKKGEVNQVMNSLQLHQENCLLKEAKGTCSAESCYNYLSKRLHQLNYKDALASELPIGSGEVESAHRSLIQKRLKIPGAWWTAGNAQSMVSLRTLRANNQWDAYWNSLYNDANSQKFKDFAR